MHSVSDALTFAVWDNGRLVRSVGVDPGNGVSENVGDPYPFELPFWAGNFDLSRSVARCVSEPGSVNVFTSLP